MSDRHSILLGFVRENARESSTRLLSLILGAAGCWMAYGVWKFAMANPKETGTTGVLASIVGTLIVSGAVAIALRTRKGGEPADAPPVQPPVSPVIPPQGPTP